MKKGKREGFDLINCEYNSELTPEENEQKWIEEYKKIYGEIPKEDD